LPGENSWYLARQLDRWQLAEKAKGNGVNVVLDGDILQPLWFSACFWREHSGDINETANFFERAMEDNKLALPDKYVCLTVDEETRAKREYERCIKAERPLDEVVAKIERYAALGLFLPKYFSALNEMFPGLVCIIEASEPAGFVASMIKDHRRSSQYSPREVVGFASSWCRQYKAKAERQAGYAA
jgi:hypothetical protein